MGDEQKEQWKNLNNFKTVVLSLCSVCIPKSS